MIQKIKKNKKYFGSFWRIYIEQKRWKVDCGFSDILPVEVWNTARWTAITFLFVACFSIVNTFQLYIGCMGWDEWRAPGSSLMVSSVLMSVSFN